MKIIRPTTDNNNNVHFVLFLLAWFNCEKYSLPVDDDQLNNVFLSLFFLQTTGKNKIGGGGRKQETANMDKWSMDKLFHWHNRRCSFFYPKDCNGQMNFFFINSWCWWSWSWCGCWWLLPKRLFRIICLFTFALFFLLIFD